jgi:hypothetical protein
VTQIQTRNLKFLIAYALLVVLPILGLVGVLKAGRELTAPLSVDGVWKVDANAIRLEALRCADKDFLQGASLLIMQSGRNLVLNVNSGFKATAWGFIEGRTIQASAVPAEKYSGESRCGEDHLFSFKATVDAESNPRSLIGTITFDGCSSCAPVNFHAVRQVRNLGKGAN